jgi:NADH-quinone oxidoreductase subunit E
MTRHTQGSLAIVGAISAGIFLVAFVALMVLGGFGVSASAFMAILVAAVAAAILYAGFGGALEAPQGLARPAVSRPAAKPAAKPAPAAAATPAPEKAAPAATVEGAKPTGLDGPRGGAADDLKQIKGVGPKLEQLLNSMGFWHFDQLANWTAAEISWVDENLEGFKGRVTRDDWVEQARVLAGGGATDFSK